MKEYNRFDSDDDSVMQAPQGSIFDGPFEAPEEMKKIILKGQCIDNILQRRCPYEYATSSSDVRIGSTWCKNCPSFVSYSTTKKEEDPLIGTYEVTVECRSSLQERK